MSSYALLFSLLLSNTVPVIEDTAAAQKEVPVQVSARIDGPVGYFSPVYIQAQIRSTDGVDAECIRLVARSSIGEIFRGDSDAACDGEQTQWQACKILGPAGQQGVIDVSCQMDPKLSLIETLTSARMLLGPQRQNALLVVNLATGDDTPPRIITTDVAIDLNPPKVAVAYGGFFGAFLLGLFLLLRERVQRNPPTKLPDANWKAVSTYVWNGTNAVIRLLQQAFTGGTVALVIILIARASEGVQPPISVTVQDFWGGTLIGLFSVPLSDWLFNTLKSVPPK